MTRITLVALFLLTACAARSEEPAKKPRAKEGFDVLGATLISIDTPIDLSSQLVRYKITGVKKIADFPTTSEQTFDRKSETEAELTIRRVAYPADCKETLPIAPTPETKKCLEANFYLESDAEIIKTLAAKALGGEKNSLAAAKKLEAFVSDYITNKTLEIAFATAKQTAESRAGDCTEHACLLAGLARAAGIPSRVVAGIVYADQFVGKKQLFAYHMWTEMLIGGKWLPFDGALHPRGGFEPGHIALAVNDMSALNCEVRLGVALINAVGNLKIEVVEQKK